MVATGNRIEGRREKAEKGEYFINDETPPHLSIQP
jgi:hypothetical protein